jgi:hypothetical protein
MINNTDSLSGIKYLKIKYTKVIPVYTKIDIAGSITLPDCVDDDDFEDDDIDVGVGVVGCLGEEEDIFYQIL